MPDVEGLVWGAIGPGAAKWLRAKAPRQLRSYVNVSTVVSGGAALALTGSWEAIRRHLNPRRRVLSNATYSANPGCVLDVYAPDASTAQRGVMVFFHGGTWTFFNKDVFRLLGERPIGFVAVIPS